MANFKIVAPVPFTVEGVEGRVYELPYVRDLDAKHLGMVGAIIQEEDMEKRVNMARDFILDLCPDLANEPLTDLAYTELFGALSNTEDEDEAGES